jgi:uncharacterized protein (TIGR03086 family)
MDTKSPDMVEMYDRALSRTEKIVADTRPEQFGDPTPCDEWNVEALLDHIIGGLLTFGADPAGETNDAMNRRGNVGDDHVESFRNAAEGARKTFRSPGILDTTLKMPWGDTPAQVALGLAVADASVHGWDLAKATGQDAGIDEDIAEVLYAMVGQMMEPNGKMPRMTAFKDPVAVPGDASAADRFIAYMGRTP